ncbi:MAG TPA: amidohydrolase family protein [Myxococcaceae bacterium]|jgi:hypothetical protein
MKRALRRMLAGLLVGLVALLAFLAATPLPRPAATFDRPAWIGPLQVVDLETGSVAANRALRIEAGRIAAIAGMDELRPDERRSMADTGGAFVMPGLWDMHAVLTRYAPSVEYPLYLAQGVTRVRNIVNCPREGPVNLYPCQSHKRGWNAETGAGQLAGPLVMGSGSYPVAGPAQRHRDAPESFAAETPEQARELVRTLAQQPDRPDHIKTYDGLPRASFFALMDEARRLGIEVSGHIPNTVTVAEASSAGLKAVAHARVLPIGCSSKEAEIVRLREAGRPASEWMRLALDSYDPERCAELWRLLAANGTFVSPTLITRFTETQTGLRELGADPVTLASTPGIVRLIWREDTAAIETRSAEDEALFQSFYRAAATRTAEAERAGVRLLLGSDTNDVFVAPGMGLHWEIELWRRAGIPSASILRAGTIHAAAYFGLESTFGRIAPGYAADLVLTERNPLEEPGTLRTPRAVMQEGRLYQREALQRMTTDAQAVAGSWRYTIHFLRDFLRNPLGFAN